MKILIITSMYPHGANPVRGTYVQEQAKVLARQHQVHILATYRGCNDDVATYHDQGMDVTYVSYTARHMLCSAHWYKKAISPFLTDILDKFQPDIIHIHDFTHFPEIFVLSSLLRRQLDKTVVTLHNARQILFPSPNILARSLQKFLFSLCMNRFKKLILVSNTLHNNIKKYLHAPLVKIIGNGIEIPPSAPPVLLKKSGKINIIAVGNIVATKGLDILIRAIAELQNPDILVHIVGDGKEKASLEQLSVELVVSRQFVWYGRLPMPEVMTMYPQADMFILPSWSETFGIVYLEAMYYGLPALGVKGQGIDGVIIDNVNGFLVAPKCVSAVVDKLQVMIAQPEITKKVGLAGLATVKSSYMLDKVCQQIAEFYEKC